jgi:hypothetical protein
LYSLVSGGGGPGLPPVSYFDAVSDTHDTRAITVILEDFICPLYRRTKKNVPFIVTDFSWAMMYAVLQALNKDTLIQYLNWCYDVVKKKVST